MYTEAVPLRCTRLPAESGLLGPFRIGSSPTRPWIDTSSCGRRDDPECAVGHLGFAPAGRFAKTHDFMVQAGDSHVKSV